MKNKKSEASTQLQMFSDLAENEVGSGYLVFNEQNRRYPRGRQKETRTRKSLG